MARILLIDDDVNTLILFKSYLKSEDHEILQAVNGFEGLEFLYNYTIDLALIDVNMPHGNGFKLLERIRRSPRFKSLPVSMVSARGEPKDIEAALKLGANSYMVKPVKREDFINKVSSLLPKVPYSSSATLTITPTAKNPYPVGLVLIEYQITSISDYGIAIKAPVPLREDQLYSLTAEIFDTIGIPNDCLKVHSIQPDGPENYKIRLSFTTLTDVDRKKIRDWVRTQKLVA